MNNLSLFLLGLVLIYVPTCLPQNSRQCFSLNLKPSYPCCTGDRVVYTDEDGDWGVEKNKWCGIGDGHPKESCFSDALGYPCCKSCKVVLTDEDGNWGVEKNKWCGIKDSCTSNDGDNDGDSESDIDFTYAILKLENKKKNMLYSPLSIEYALKMLQEGAAENTYDEINKVVGKSEPTKYESFGKNLSLANGIFIRDTYYDRIYEEYINILKEKYNAEIKKDKFSSAQNANNWISEKTLGIIENTLTDDMVTDPGVVMLLINALAIDMEWVLQFSADDTYGRTFYLDDGSMMTAAMMCLDEKVSPNIGYYLDDDLTVLTMNLKKYNETQLEFVALMPKENLSGFVENISKEKMSEIDSKIILSSSTKDGVNVKIPKFKYDYELSLKEDLMKLGIRDAFDQFKADFSKMGDAKEKGEYLFVSDGIHKAEIEFTEKGARAAAVTVIRMTAVKALPPPPKYPVNIVIDKPFMFIIRDKFTKDVWFTGTVYVPTKYNPDDYKVEYKVETVTSKTISTKTVPTKSLSYY